jgi:hypothetical protein
MSFAPATREKTKLKMCIAGPSGGGKSYSSLRLAHAMVAAGLGTKIAVIESEAGKIKKYAGYIVDGIKWAFDVCVLESFSPQEYTAKLELAHRMGYDIVIIDSISHEWQGKGGALEIVDKVQGANKFAGWKTVTPMHNSFVDTVLRLPVHVIATCRSKMGYVMEETTKADGKTVTVPKKIGLEPMQRGGIEYEFEIFCEIDQSHILRVAKTICPLIDNKTCIEPGPDFWTPVFAWLNEGVEVVDTGYRSALVPAERLEALMDAMNTYGVDVDKGLAWIRVKFGATEWAHLTPTQFEQFEGWAKVQIGNSKAASERLNAPSANAAPTPTTNAAPTPTTKEAVKDEQDPVLLTTPVKEPAGHDAHNIPAATPAAAVPTVAVDPNAPYARPANLAPTLSASVVTLWEELAHLQSLTQEQKMDALAAVCKQFNPAATRPKELADDQLAIIEKKLVLKIRSTYAERGMSNACPF